MLDSLAVAVTLKMQDQKMQDQKKEDHIASQENAGLENMGPYVRAGKCRTKL